MKIGFDAKRAMVNHTGLGNYSRFVIQSLRNNFPEHSYQLYAPKLGSQSVLDKIKKKEKIEIITNAKERFLWRSFGITDDIRREKLDIYHGLSNELPFNIDKTGTKSVVTIHDLIFLTHPHFYPVLERNIYNFKAKYACKHADKIIAVSECTKKDIINYYNINPNKIEVVYQGCSNDYKQELSKEQQERIKVKYNLPKSYLLSVGSIEDRKNILLIAKALRLVPDLHFVAVGKKRKYAEKLISYAENYNLSDRLHIIENLPQEDLPAILQASSLFVYPSLYEGFGIPIIEALHSKVPVIAATGSCLEEAGGKHSIYVNPTDEEDLAEQIRKVLEDENLRTWMIEKGLEHVKQFETELSAKQIMNIYQSII